MILLGPFQLGVFYDSAGMLYMLTLHWQWNEYKNMQEKHHQPTAETPFTCMIVSCNAAQWMDAVVSSRGVCGVFS